MSNSETVLLNIFAKLTETQQGELIGRAALFHEQNRASENYSAFEARKKIIVTRRKPRKSKRSEAK